MSYWRVLAISRATWRASSVSSRLILRASAFGQHLAFDGQAWAHTRHLHFANFTRPAPSCALDTRSTRRPPCHLASGKRRIVRLLRCEFHSCRQF